MFNNLKEAVSWIETQSKFKPKTNLERMEAAFKLLNLSFFDARLVHVAGTNGKGSVCAYLTQIGLEKGLTVGTFTSPYLINFNERIRLNGKEISDTDLISQINNMYHFNTNFTESYGENLAFFELVTLMALSYFNEKKVDLLIMEVGLGGLLDATNILNYDVSLITNIGFDHMKQLGNTLESIAINKLGILKPGNHLITTVDRSLHSFFNNYLKAKNVSSKLITPEAFKIKSYQPVVYEYKNNPFTLPLLGKHQVFNSVLAIEAAFHLYPDIDVRIIQEGLKKALWPGRLEMIRPFVYLDGAHNIHALTALNDTLKETFKDKNIKVLFSALGDKDIGSMLEVVKQFSEEIIMTSFEDSRFKDLSSYQNQTMKYIQDFQEAYAYLLTNLGPKDIVLITGSLHFVGYAKKALSSL